MKFENPELPEGVNVSHEHPLKEFSQLLLGVLVCVIVFLIVLHYSAQYLVKYIPFRYEVAMIERMGLFQESDVPLHEKRQQAQLQALVDQLSNVMLEGEDVDIVVHYSNQDVVNAFATLGGHILIYQGLLDQLNSEQALAMVLAHEIAHVRLRHPISSLSKGLTLVTFSALITGVTGSSEAELLINSSNNLGLLTFSREQERQSDLLAAKAIHTYYGNIAGAKDLFATFEALQQGPKYIPEIFMSHPHSDTRWQVLLDNAINDSWVVEGLLSDIPIEIKGESAISD